MEIREEIREDLYKIIRETAAGTLKEDFLSPICERLNIVRLKYNVTAENQGNAVRVGRPVMGNDVRPEIVLYDSGERTGVTFEHAYNYRENLTANASVAFRAGIKEESLDREFIGFLMDFIFLMESRKNMSSLLDYAENSDGQTGIPNLGYLAKKYNVISERLSPEALTVIRTNIQTFKHINDMAGARAGDEAIIQYAQKLQSFVDEDECACRLGGDNFVLFVKNEHEAVLLERLKCVLITNLRTAPGKKFELAAWIGLSKLMPGENKPFLERLNDCSTACDIGKSRLKKSVVVYDSALEEVVSHNREIIAMFRPAVRNHEFHPFFQSKVDMRTGRIIGFETLCRWIHEGSLIYPDQFIPVLDRSSLIPELDIAIFEETCAAIRQWKGMGLNPPRISTNFSKKDLFVPGIEDRILEIIYDYGLDTGDLEVEITETVKDTEYERLISFVRNLRSHGLHISIDDFGTGYSSLSLIHNIDADVIKIDKSFVSLLPEDERSKILIESIVSIAKRLNMDIIAEGVENGEQSRTLLELGCTSAQGYYFGKPVDFDAATKLIEEQEDI